jgi:hypothetical protein
MADGLLYNYPAVRRVEPGSLNRAISMSFGEASTPTQRGTEGAKVLQSQPSPQPRSKTLEGWWRKTADTIARSVTVLRLAIFPSRTALLQRVALARQLRARQSELLSPPCATMDSVNVSTLNGSGAQVADKVVSIAAICGARKFHGSTVRDAR